MVITSQNLDLIERLSDEVLVLERGESAYYGDPKTGIEQYQRILNEQRPLHVYSDKDVWRETKWWANMEEQWGVREGTKEVEIEGIRLLDRWGSAVDEIEPGDPLTVQVHFLVREEILNPHFGIALFREDRVYCYGPNTEFDDLPIERITPGSGSFSLAYEHFDLMPGRYFFSIAIWDKKETVAYDYVKGQISVTVLGNNPEEQLVRLHARFDGEIFGRSQDKKAARIKASGIIDSKNSDELIGKVRSLDWLGREKEEFFTGEKMKIEVEHDCRRRATLKKPSLWIGIFRSDNIFCYARMRRLSCKDKRSVLTFPSLPLLPGNYRIAVGIWDERLRACAAFKPKAYALAMCCRRQDHGTMYLHHSWNINIDQPKR
jgi:hypothetical protein